MARKPTGRILGRRQLSLNEGRAELSEARSFKLPEDKNAAEDVVMQKFVGVSNQDNARGLLEPLLSATKFPTDHGPDFDVVHNDATRTPGFFELLEIAPLTGPYETASGLMLVGELVDFVVAQIETKVAKYAPRQYRPISLLCYVGHFAFEPGPSEIMAFQQTLQGLTNSVFTRVYLQLFAHDGNPFVVPLWPWPHRHFTRSQLTGVRRRQMVRPDPAKGEILSDRSSGDHFDVTIRQYLPAGTDLSGLKLGELTEEMAQRLGIGGIPEVRPKK